MSVPFHSSTPAWLLALGVMACNHSEPFALEAPVDRPPFGETLPRQLTFNPGDDIFPSVAGSTIAFSRREPARADGDYCLALLPAEGGVLVSHACAGGDEPDGTQDAWLAPALSPDGDRVAFVRQRGLPGASHPASRDLVVAALGDPSRTAETVIAGGFSLPGGGFANAFRRVEWTDPDTLRFIGGLEIPDTFTRDTVFTPLGLFEVSPGGAPEPVAGIGPPRAWATGAAGEVWFVLESGPLGVYRRPAGATVPELATIVGGVPGNGATPVSIDDLTVAGDVLVIVLRLLLPFGGGDAYQILSLDIGNGGAVKPMWSTDRPRRVFAVPGTGRVVAEIVRGDRGDLWLLEVR